MKKASKDAVVTKAEKGSETETRGSRQITSSSTAEYFSKNLQQVGFSSPTKAVLTTLKEAFDNALDACEEHGILPDVRVVIEKRGAGSLKNTDRIMVRVEDNGPGIPYGDVAKVFGEYLASSKFGRGRCTRGQQGIGISAATTWAMQTSATGAAIITKVAKQRRAQSCQVEIDLKNNKGVVKNREEIEWDRESGTAVEFLFDGRIQLNGESGILAFLRANVLVNPHLRLTYQVPDMEEVVVERVSQDIPLIPDAIEPHPHTMKLGEFLAHARAFGRAEVRTWLRKGFSRISDGTLQELQGQHNVPKAMYDKALTSLSDSEINTLYQGLQALELKPPSTSSVLAIGEDGLAKSIQRLGSVDFYSVVSRRPCICDFKPVQVEVAVARLESRGDIESEEPVQVLRFANRVPLQFDKAGCAIVKAITSVNWKSYGLRQPKGALPQGPYIIAVSVVSPFIKFKNASKETIDGSDELVEELRRTLIQAGQKLSRHLNREHREADLESKIQHIEKFAPILVECLVRIAEANEERKLRAEQGLMRLLGRDAKEAEKELETAEERLSKHLKKERNRRGNDEGSEGRDDEGGDEDFAPLNEDLEASELDMADMPDEAAGKKRGRGAKGKGKAAAEAGSKASAAAKTKRAAPEDLDAAKASKTKKAAAEDLGTSKAKRVALEDLGVASKKQSTKSESARADKAGRGTAKAAKSAKGKGTKAAPAKAAKADAKSRGTASKGSSKSAPKGKAASTKAKASAKAPAKTAKGKGKKGTKARAAAKGRPGVKRK